ncbi:MAG: hypothetical protein ACI89X_001324 [Planctomycetota bacterium]
MFVTSIERQGARALERQKDLEAELQLAKAKVPDVIAGNVLKHQHTIASLQLIARLHDAITKIRRTANETKTQSTALAAGDARMVDTMRLIDRHVALLEARAVSMPQVTTAKVIEKFDWHGDTYAIGARLVHSELIEFYRKSFSEIARDARAAKLGADDERAKTQYQALRELSESLKKVLEAEVLRKR